MYPNCSTGAEMKSDAFKQRYKDGPWGVLTILPQAPNFGLNLAKAFVVYLIITLMVAYLASLSVMAGAEYGHVFRVVGTAAILGHCMGGLVNDVFLGKPARFIVTSFVDAVVYALLTAGVMAAMWPAGEVAGAVSG